MNAAEPHSEAIKGFGRAKSRTGTCSEHDFVTEAKSRYPPHASHRLSSPPISVTILRCNNAAIAQLVERIHGKDEVSGSNPDRGSILNYLPFTICFTSVNISIRN